MRAKKERGSFKEVLSDLFELPREVMLDLPRMTLVGNVQVYLENHRGVIAYTETQVRVGVKNGAIIIRGQNLQIKNLLEEELLIKGVIEGLDYEA